MKGLLKKRKPDTVYSWLSRFRDQGIPGLFHKSGRGRKPAFAPKSAEDAEEELQTIVGMSPDTNSAHPTRWTLQQIKESVPWLTNISVPGVHDILSRLGISYKRGRTYIHSPDVAYKEKMICVAQALEQAKQYPDTYVALYEDEFAFHRRPTLAKDWTQRGTKEPLAHQGLGSDLTCFGIGALNTHWRCRLPSSKKCHRVSNTCVLHSSL